MKRRRSLSAGAAMLAAAIGTVASAHTAGTDPASTTVPFVLDHNRMTVEVEFQPPGSSVRKAHAWIDTGGTSLVLERAGRRVTVRAQVVRLP